MAKSTDGASLAAIERHGNVVGLLSQADDVFSDTVALRRELHRWPEIGNHLPTTREQVLSALEGLPLDITLHESTSGIVATLTGDKPGDTVLLRGDMDRVPGTAERRGVSEIHPACVIEWQSRPEGG